MSEEGAENRPRFPGHMRWSVIVLRGAMLPVLLSLFFPWAHSQDNAIRQALNLRVEVIQLRKDGNVSSALKLLLEALSLRPITPPTVTLKLNLP